MTIIGSYAFSGCSGLESIDISNSVRSIGVYAFSETAWLNNQPNGLVYAGKVAYVWKGEMPENTSIVLKRDTKGIGSYAFCDCKGLYSITIPEDITHIGYNCIYGCNHLTNVICLNPIPPTIENQMSDYYTATLYVPHGCREAY